MLCGVWMLNVDGVALFQIPNISQPIMRNLESA